MKLLAITALFIAGALAVPASSYPPPPPSEYGGDHGGDNGGYSPVPSSSGDGYGYVTPTPTPPPPPSSYDDGGDYEPPTNGDGDSSDDGDDGDDSDGGSDVGDGKSSGSNMCSGTLYSVAQCCSTLVLNIIGLDCDKPKTEPHSVQELKSICAKEGQQDACCGLKVATLGVLCTEA